MSDKKKLRVCAIKECTNFENPRLRAHPEIPRCKEHAEHQQFRKCSKCGSEDYVHRCAKTGPLCHDCYRTKQQEPEAEDVPQIEYLRNRITELNKLNKNLLRTAGEQKEMAATVAESVRATAPFPKYSYSRPKKSKSSISAVIMLSDWHIGEVIQANETEGFGQYDFEIAQDRLFNILTAFINWIDVQRSAYLIDSCAVFSVGDMISGDIHQELMVTNEFPIPVQAAKAGLLLGEAIRRIASHFKTVDVYEIGADNHSRLTKKPQAKQAAQNSMSYLVHTIANCVTEKHTNVKPHLAKGIKQVATVAGSRFLLEHENTVKAWMGIPYYGMQRERGREAIKRMNTPHTFDYLACGHWHVPGLIEGSMITNGSLSGTSEYDHSCGRHANPCQMAFLVHPKKRVFNLVPFTERIKFD